MTYENDEGELIEYEDGRRIIDLTNPHILEDMDYFRERAIFLRRMVDIQLLLLIPILNLTLLNSGKMNYIDGNTGWFALMVNGYLVNYTFIGIIHLYQLQKQIQTLRVRREWKGLRDSLNLG